MSDSKLQVRFPSDREIAISRAFDAPPTAVFEALTRCELIRRWLIGPPGWSMIVCECDARPGGQYRHVLRSDADGSEMGWGGTFQEVDRPRRIVASERFDEPWYPGEAIITYDLAGQEGSTILTMTMRLESPQGLEMVRKTPMEKGVAMSYDRLEELLREE